jgi:two-component system phosphate regulon sensor histidine kinase PhoR
LSKKLQYIIAFSAFAVIGLVILQINWVNHAAKLREGQFDHRVNMALCSAIDKISEDKQACSVLGLARDGSKDEFKITINQLKVNTSVDSVLNHELKYYKVELPYEYDIVWFNHKEQNIFSVFSLVGLSAKPYKLSLCRIEQAAGLELMVRFPGKGYYIYAQMGLMLISSIVLIFLIALGFIITIQTIVEQKRIHTMTTEFITNMTHEFKTPLASIALASNMLKKGKVSELSEKGIKYANMISEENERLKENVEQVLNMAKLEKGEFKLKYSQASLHELIQKAVGTVGMQVQNREGNISYQLDANRSEVEVDQLHIINAISNLLDNANKYSPNSPAIEVSTRNEADNIIISVKDHGIGMGKDKQKLVFNKFYRVPTGNRHDVKGFGLGLAYVKMIVERHHGKVNVSSELGKGSCFEIELPLKKVA